MGKAFCECCKKSEKAGQCCIGTVMCPCETKTEMLWHTVLICPDCDKCPAHCLCGSCSCGFVANSFMFHKSDCDIRLACREKIQQAEQLLIKEINSLIQCK